MSATVVEVNGMARKDDTEPTAAWFDRLRESEKIAEATAARINSHEAVCAMRYEKINDKLDSLTEDAAKLWYWSIRGFIALCFVEMFGGRVLVAYIAKQAGVPLP